ncbi:8680_t:CDS:1, partial [Cetraspora pellucida]
VYKKVPSLEEIVKEELHDEAHRGYMEEYGNALEKKTFFSQINKSLCRVEAILGYSCSEAQGTSRE